MMGGGGGGFAPVPSLKPTLIEVPLDKVSG
jgi:hypothetical protein